MTDEALFLRKSRSEDPLDRAISNFELFVIYSNAAKERMSPLKWLLRIRAQQRLIAAMEPPKVYPSPFVAYGMMLLKKGQIKEGLDTLNSAARLQKAWIEHMCDDTHFRPLNADHQRVQLASVLTCIGLHSFKLGLPDEALQRFEQAQTTFLALSAQAREENLDLQQEIWFGSIESLFFLRRFEDALKMCTAVLEEFVFKEYSPKPISCILWLRNSLPDLISFSKQLPGEDLPQPFVPKFMERVSSCTNFSEARRIRQQLLIAAQTADANAPICALSQRINHQTSSIRKLLQQKEEKIRSSRPVVSKRTQTIPCGEEPEGQFSQLMNQMQQAHELMDQFLDACEQVRTFRNEITLMELDALERDVKKIAASTYHSSWKDRLQWIVLESSRFSLVVIGITILFDVWISNLLSPTSRVTGLRQFVWSIAVTAFVAAVQYFLQEPLDNWLLGIYKRRLLLQAVAIGNRNWSRYNVLLDSARKLNEFEQAISAEPEKAATLS